MTWTALPMDPGAARRRDLARAALGRHSRSFALAARLLPPRLRDQAALIYAFCRRADDAIDLSPPGEQHMHLSRLVAELDAVYRGDRLTDDTLAGFQAVALARRIPRDYPAELLAGLAMDASFRTYETTKELLGYCFRVAGTVGLMMCHVMGVRRAGALRHAADLGIAMQLTNICRDVAEDWRRGRLYLPADLLRAAGAPPLRPALGQPLPAAAARPMARVIAKLLDRADRFYRSGDAGLVDLEARAALAVRAARLLYSGIGDELRRRGCDPRAGRASVPAPARLRLLARAGLGTLALTPRLALAPPVIAPPEAPPLRFAVS